MITIGYNVISFTITKYFLEIFRRFYYVELNSLFRRLRQFLFISIRVLNGAEPPLRMIHSDPSCSVFTYYSLLCRLILIKKGGPMEKYPKEVKLKSNETVTLRLFEPDDLETLIRFYQSLPESDRMFLRIDVMNRQNIIRRYGNPNYDYIYPVIAMDDHQIIGEGTLFRAEFGWMRHTGELRCVVSEKYKRKGLCTILVRELFLHAVSTDLYKIQAAVMEEQKSAIAVAVL